MIRAALRALGIAALLAAAPAALAHGGGGEGFGGGGGGDWGGGGGFGGGDWGGGGSSFDFGGGGGSGSPPLVFLIVVLLVVVAFLLLMARDRVRAGTARPALPPPEVRADHAALLRAADPSFDEAAFLAHARRAFAAVQDGWCAHDLKLPRPYVSDAVFERFSLQIEEQRDLGYRDRMENLRVLGADLVESSTEGPCDAVTVLFRWRAADYRVALADGRRLERSRMVLNFSEYWTFLRWRGAPGAATGAAPADCPNCGARLVLNEGAPCASCGAAVRCGRHGWVLVDLTHPTVWRPSLDSRVRGAAAVRARDPGLHLMHVEERATVLFWRLARAERLGRTWRGERAVGTVEALGFLPGERDRALVKILWRGVDYEREGDGPPRAGERGPILGDLLVLERAGTARTAPDAAVFSTHCPSCGAPEPGPGVDSGTCPSCGSTLDDGSRNWVLAGTEPWGSPAARALVAALAHPEAPATAAAAPAGGRPDRGLFLWAAALAVADGTLHPVERDGLLRLAARSGIRAAEALAWIAAAGLPGGSPPAPPDAATAREWRLALEDLAMADGRVDPAEQAVLDRLGTAS